MGFYNNSEKLLTEAIHFIKFNLVGVITTIVGIPLMILLDHMKVSYMIFTALNYVIGIVLGFVLNWRISFKATSKDHPFLILVRYLVVFFVLLLLVQGLQYLLIEHLLLPKWIGIILGMVFYGGLGYLICRLWVFTNHSTD